VNGPDPRTAASYRCDRYNRCFPLHRHNNPLHLVSPALIFIFSDSFLSVLFASIDFFSSNHDYLVSHGG
jgi:hypothetical protein